MINTGNTLMAITTGDTIFNLYWTKWALAVVCFSFFFFIFFSGYVCYIKLITPSLSFESTYRKERQKGRRVPYLSSELLPIFSRGLANSAVTFSYATLFQKVPNFSNGYDAFNIYDNPVRPTGDPL